MKILWLTRENPSNANRGDILYSKGLLRALADNGAEISVLSTGFEEKNQHSPSQITEKFVFPKLRSRALSLFSFLPSDVFRLGFLDFRKAVELAVGLTAYDAVVIDHIAMAWALPILLRHHSKNKFSAIIYVSHNAEAETRFSVARGFRVLHPFRWLLSLDALKYRVLETRLIKAVDLVTAITSHDASAMADLAPRRAILVLTPGYDCPTEIKFRRFEDIPRRCVIVGSFEWLAKRENLRQFISQAAGPFKDAGIELQIVGRISQEFGDQVKRMADFCDVVGPVPDVTPYIRDARIGIMPDASGGGFKLKFLDYVFNGAVVAGLKAQISGVPENLEAYAIACTSVKGVISSVIDKIDACSDLENMREEALDTCLNAFDWQDRGRMLFSAIEQIKGAEGPDVGGAVLSSSLFINQ